MRKTCALLSVLLAVTTTATLACSQATEQCDCVSNEIQVHIPADIAAAAEAPTLSGSCASNQITCSQQAAGGGCTLYTFAPNAAGTCTVQIDFTTGRVFTADIKVSQSTGCCAGFYAQPASAADVEVPEGT